MKRLFGAVCATITPFTKDMRIDEDSLRKLCDFLADSGINGIYPNGTNGEGILLSREERKRIAEILVDQNKNRMSVFIQATAATEEETVQNIVDAVEAQADGVGVMTPIFFRQDAEAMYQYYKRLHDAAPDFPMYMYNIPSHSNNDIAPAVFGRITKDFGNFLGIKYSNSDLMRIQDYLMAADRKVDVLIGCDSLILPCLMTGGVGGVSGPCAVFGKRFSKMLAYYHAGDYEAARELQMKIVQTDRNIAGVPGIPAIKAMLKMEGVIENDICKEPFRPLTKEERNILEHEVDRYLTEG